MNLDFNWGKYFTEEEFKCSHTGKCDMDQDFIDRMNQLREQYGKPIKITSGYRDATHPIEARKKSQEHMHQGMPVILEFEEEMLYKL